MPTALHTAHHPKSLLACLQKSPHVSSASDDEDGGRQVTAKMGLSCLQWSITQLLPLCNLAECPQDHAVVEVVAFSCFCRSCISFLCISSAQDKRHLLTSKEW